MAYVLLQYKIIKPVLSFAWFCSLLYCVLYYTYMHDWHNTWHYPYEKFERDGSEIQARQMSET